MVLDQELEKMKGILIIDYYSKSQLIVFESFNQIVIVIKGNA